MGLDCYLTARKHVSSHHTRLTEAVTKWSVKGLSALGGLKALECDAAYWRKANQIHHWFVTNAQDGEDDGKRYPVEQAQLAELLETCLKIKENPSLAEHLLPTQSGFFFGSLDYGKEYMEGIEDTIAQLEKFVGNEDLEGWYFYYQASW